MNQEKEMMQIVNSAGEYTAPKVKVVEIKARRVVCASDQDAQNNGYNSNDYQW